MEDTNFVYGDENRIFINTDMGCDSGCQYCYLSSLNIIHGTRKINAHKAIDLVHKLGYYRSGEGGSIISIGCYSECMEEDNIIDTITLIKYFVQRNNYVQLATKKKMPRYFFEEICKLDDVSRYLWIYISIPVITDFKILELKTDSPFERVKNFELCKEYNIHAVLYIKPVLKNITDRDISKYIEVIYEYNLPVVVGKFLSIKPTLNQVLVGEKRLYEQSEELKEFINKLGEITKVYSHSTECIESFRDETFLLNT